MPCPGHDTRCHDDVLESMPDNRALQACVTLPKVPGDGFGDMALRLQAKFHTGSSTVMHVHKSIFARSACRLRVYGSYLHHTVEPEDLCESPDVIIDLLAGVKARANIG